MDQAGYYKCVACGYEFLSKGSDPACPRCKGKNLESKDMRGLARFDE